MSKPVMPSPGEQFRWRGLLPGAFLAIAGLVLLLMALERQTPPAPSGGDATTEDGAATLAPQHKQRSAGRGGGTDENIVLPAPLPPVVIRLDTTESDAALELSRLLLGYAECHRAYTISSVAEAPPLSLSTRQTLAAVGVDIESLGLESGTDDIVAAFRAWSATDAALALRARVVELAADVPIEALLVLLGGYVAGITDLAVIGEIASSLAAAPLSESALAAWGELGRGLVATPAEVQLAQQLRRLDPRVLQLCQGDVLAVKTAADWLGVDAEYPRLVYSESWLPYHYWGLVSAVQGETRESAVGSLRNLYVEVVTSDSHVDSRNGAGLSTAIRRFLQRYDGAPYIDELIALLADETTGPATGGWREVFRRIGEEFGSPLADSLLSALQTIQFMPEGRRPAAQMWGGQVAEGFLHSRSLTTDEMAHEIRVLLASYRSTDDAAYKMLIIGAIKTVVLRAKDRGYFDDFRRIYENDFPGPSAERQRNLTWSVYLLNTLSACDPARYVQYVPVRLAALDLTWRDEWGEPTAWLLLGFMNARGADRDGAYDALERLVAHTCAPWLNLDKLFEMIEWWECWDLLDRVEELIEAESLRESEQQRFDVERAKDLLAAARVLAEPE